MRVLSAKIACIGILVWLIGGCSTTGDSARASGRTDGFRAWLGSAFGCWWIPESDADSDGGKQAGQNVFPDRLGSSGVGVKSRRATTDALEYFRVGWINDNSRFKRFIGLDYP
ncbi:MAG: hypothetical protein IPL51_13140 [Candidatus Competibacteraceae bacterium]|nr:hypothetical protein [Candidatus Competibacteraceae bacterium]